jgi:arylsulfatase A-like enzyme
MVVTDKFKSKKECLPGKLHSRQKQSLLFFVILLNSITVLFAQPNKAPNIILIIADDLGYSDLASYGNKNIHTPNIDGLGKEGIRFTQAYVTAPICAPSRMAIMTGRYQQRFGTEFMPYDKFDPVVQKKIAGYFFSFRKKPGGIKTLHPHFLLSRSAYETGLPGKEITIADLLKKQGYATAMIGKWNLGSSAYNFPDQHGFDYSYYFNGALSRYVDDPVDTARYINQHLPWAFSEIPAWASRMESTAIIEGRTEVKDTGYLTFSFASKGIDFIEKNKDKPFFMVLSFNAPHDPFQVPKTYFDRVQNTADTVKRVYYAMIEALDDAVGNVLQKLDQEGLSRKTIIFFISDNGGATYTKATENAPLRGGKCTHFEGGLLVPFFIKYPGILSGENTFTEAVSSLDIFSTVAGVSGAALPAGRSYDGVNLIPFCETGQGRPHEKFFWRNGYSKAYRKGDWKLYVNDKDKVQYLFNIAEDRGENADLSGIRPEIMKELTEELKQWEKKNTRKPLWPSGADMKIDVRGKKFQFPG